MFPTYKAVKLLKVIAVEHGHTEPWVVLCEGENKLEAFVVKIFTEEHLLEKPRVHGEFCGTWMAGEFDLLTPEVAWIEMDQDFILSLSPELEQKLDFHDDRLKFGSKVLPQFQHFPTGFNNSQFVKYLPVDRLFAFDNFIRNADRGSHKPNLLLTPEEDAFLIDHEYALEIDSSTISDIQNFILPGRFSSTHIAYPVLVSGSANQKQHYFEEFEIYLRSLNLKVLGRVLGEVGNQGYQAELGMIMDYFKFIQSNPTIFVNLLKRQIL
ncbi:HipA family kinase [Algoriphagus sp.]|uniref:HipA family kinase n=1 Tax=Algoriphagus sp. TaxID=1872435 RepID=UPI003F701219